MLESQPVSNVGQIVSVLKDAGFLISTVVVGWKARDLFQPIKDFFCKANLFMDESSKTLKSLDSNMNTLMTNHLSHLPTEIAAAMVGAMNGKDFPHPIMEAVEPVVDFKENSLET